MKQWWGFKQLHMDTVLFFKVGKFYELFHMDADIGFSELELIYMKGSKAHSGFPEVSYGKFASVLVSKGYRVARVEQVETPEMMKERNDSAAKGTKKEKVVAREICSVMSKGTRTYCHLDDLSLLQDEGGKRFESSSVLICVVDGVCRKEQETVRAVEFGVCCVDTIIGTVTLSQFEDDKQCSRLRTMLARYQPNEVLVSSNPSNKNTIGIVKLIAPQAKIEYLGKDELPTATKAISNLKKGKYYQSDITTKNDTVDEWPPIVKAVVEGLEDGSSELVCRALGGCLWQLSRSLIDYEILSMKSVFAYIPTDENLSSVNYQSHFDELSSSVLFQNTDVQEFDDSTNQTNERNRFELKSMTLDEVALSNLEVLVNNYDTTEKGSLWAFINRSKTSFGKRLLRSWLCHPLYKPCDILKRSNAVEELITSFPDQSESSRNLLKGLFCNSTGCFLIHIFFSS
jgi:DNA mismatch repair protein MSH6